MNSDSQSSRNYALLEEGTGFSGVPLTSPGHSVARATHRVLSLRTSGGLELLNLTERVEEVVRAAQVREGLVLVSSLHTTLALMVNEWQEALLEDIRGMLDDLIPAGKDYRHNDPRHSDCDRRNAHSHLRAALLGHSVSFGVTGGRLSLGQFQAIIAAELDGPRERQVTVQVFSFA
jgi:secondary thiamine-phosphate synthase enzyme